MNNNGEVFDQIVNLIEDKMRKYRKPLTRSTDLERDLGITGDDAFELLETFSEKFNVDLSDFEMKKYFSPEGDGLLNLIIGLFRGKKSESQAEVGLTIGDLERAAMEGKLV